MTNFVAIAPETGEIESYLTNGKAYPIIKIIKEDYNNCGRSFIICDDRNNKIYSNENYSGHLNGLSWTIKEKNERSYQLICITYLECALKDSWIEEITNDDALTSFLESWNIPLDFPYPSKNSISKVLIGNNESNTEIIHIRIVRFNY